MTRDALTEWFGDSVDVTIFANHQLRVPHGLPGAVAYYVLRPNTPSLVVTLPDATRCAVSAGLVVANHGSNSFAIKDQGGATIATLAVGNACELWCRDNSTAAGAWTTVTSSSTLGTALTHEREPIDVVISESLSTGINLREWCFDLGWKSDLKPYAVRCTVMPGITIGRTDSTSDAFYTGQWPANSNLVLVLQTGAMISGRGGAGGRGGDAGVGLLAQAGGDGGHGLSIEVNTALLNYGTIQGGGGGGGGGVRYSTGSSGTVIPGAGGGGGAGYLPGAGGSQGNDAAGVSGTGTGNGAGGGVLASGWSGWTGYLQTSAGQGGGPGSNGVSGTGAAGGVAGSAIRRVAAYTLTKLVAGTITGAEVVI